MSIASLSSGPNEPSPNPSFVEAGGRAAAEGLDPSRMARQAAAAESFLKSIANRHRLLILCTLLERELSVGELAEKVGLAQSNLSRHLATLRRRQLVATRRAGTTIFYRVHSARVRPILAELYRMFCMPPAG